MVGLLNAPRNTRLYQRLVKEGRLLKDVSGDNTDFSINFTPAMDYETLMEGYKRIIKRIYSPEPYFKRVREFLRNYKPLGEKKFYFRFTYIKAFFKSILFLGILGRERFYYWKLFFGLYSDAHEFSIWQSRLAFMVSIFGKFLKNVCEIIRKEKRCLTSYRGFTVM